MPVLLQGFYVMGSEGVPCPNDGSPSADWWWDHLAKQALSLAQAGFTAIWLPPPFKGASGIKSVGYDPFDDYDLGSKNQMQTVPTRYGTREQLARCVAVMRSCGIDVYVDLVDSHRDGDTTPFTFRYLGADGTAEAGRFAKDPSNFYPNVPRDPQTYDDPGAVNDFGRVLAPINATPKGYVSDGLVAATDWLTRSLGLQGYRLDDVKLTAASFFATMLNTGSMQGKFTVGEFYEDDLSRMSHWVFDPAVMNGRASAFDFPMRDALAKMCNGQPFGMWGLDHLGFAGQSPFNAVTFVENHDTDSDPNKDPVLFNKALAYAYVLTSEGYPSVYYKDYSQDPGCYGLKPVIDNLMWINHQFASGPTQQRWKDQDVFSYERLGQPGLLVALNNDPNNGRTITVQTNFGPNRQLHDYTGHFWDIWTDGSGQATFTVPRKSDGNGVVTGYVCFAPAGVSGAINVGQSAVTQDFEAAEDLDTAPAVSGAATLAGRVWARKGTKIDTQCAPLPAGANLQVTVLDVQSKSLGQTTFPGKPLSVKVGSSGWYSIEVEATALPAGSTSLAYRLSVSYTAPQGL